jgi:hypothetical protein
MERGEKLYFKRQFLLVEFNPEISIKMMKMSNKRGIKLTHRHNHEKISGIH